jgi:DNA-binding GntR family transcriptional regulator
MPVPQSTGEPERTLLRDSVRQRLRDAILDGTLEPGERLHDDELIAWLGVSRTPIREALGQLATSGLVEMSANRFTRVAKPTPDDVLSALQTLGVLFGGVVRLSVASFSSKQQAALVKDISGALKLVEKGQIAAVAFGSLPIYEDWLAACPNELLVSTCRQTMDGLAFRLRDEALESLMPSDVIAPIIRELLEAVRNRDPIAAELAMERVHLLPGTRPVA